MSDLTLTELKISNTGPANGIKCAFSPDNDYLSIVHPTSPYVTIYKRDGETFTRLPDPSELPTGFGEDTTFSPDGKYLVVAHDQLPFITIYKRDGDTFTKLPNPYNLPSGNSYGCGFSPDSKYLTIAQYNGTRIVVYKIENDIFTKIPNPSPIPPNNSRDATFSHDGKYLVMCFISGPYAYVYKRDGDTFTKIVDLPNIPNVANGSSFSPDDKYLAIAHATIPFITIYKKDGDTFTKLPNPNELPASTGNDCTFSPDGRHLIVGHNSSPYVTIYERVGDTFTKIPNPDKLPQLAGYGCAISPNGKHICISLSGSPAFMIYKTNFEFMKLLIKSNENLKAISPKGEIEDLNDITIDSNLFISKGVLPNILNEHMSLLSSLENPIEILCWVPETEITEASLEYEYGRIKPPIVKTEMKEKYNQLGDKLKVVSYTTEPYDLKINKKMNIVSEIKYLLSKDNTEWFGYNGTIWVKDYAMTKEQLEAIPIVTFQEWIGESIYKYDLYIKYLVKNEDSDLNMIVNNISVNYNPNQAPIIIDPLIDPNEIHAEFATLTATLKDLEGDSLQYRTSIKKAGEEEFTVVDDWDNVPPSNKILRAYNQPYFNLGDNILKLEVREQRGLISEWSGNVIMVNDKPTILMTYDDFGINGTFDDVNGDAVAIQISIDDKIIYPFDTFIATPRKFKYTWETKHTTFGQPSTVKVELKDSFEEVVSEDFNIIGQYKNILFMDEDGNYYSSDEGVILKTLDMDRVVIPNYSEVKMIKLKNNTTYPLRNVSVQANKDNIPTNSMIEFSEVLDPFNPKEILQLTDMMNHGDVKDIYVRVKATEGRGSDNITATISSTGSIIY